MHQVWLQANGACVVSLYPGFYDQTGRHLNASDAARQAYLYRPDDIDLGKWWNAMRVKQREEEYAIGVYNSQSANAYYGYLHNALGGGYANALAPIHSILGSGRNHSSNWTKE